MLTRKPKLARVCHIILRNMGDKRKGGVKKPYSTEHMTTPKYKMPFDKAENDMTGVSFDKMIGKNEVKVLSYMDKHPHKTTPMVIPDRIHDVTELVPGFSVGPKFWDGEAGDTTAQGNKEAIAINNFLHLSPPMIKHHTAELKKLCTPPPPKPDKCIRQYRTSYVYSAPSIKHPLAREASLRVKISDLNLDEEIEGYFRELISANRNMDIRDLNPHTYEHHRLPKIMRDIPILLEYRDDVLTIHAKQCPTRKQNLSLCYYRLSGFISEARALKPVFREINLGKFTTDFVFDQDESVISRFEEKNYVAISRTSDGGISGMTGTPEALDSAEQIINEVANDVIAEELSFPNHLRNFMLRSKAFKDILASQEAIYSDDNIVAFCDSIENVKEDVASLLSSINQFPVPCPPNLTRFVLTPRFLERVTSEYDGDVTDRTDDVTNPTLLVTVVEGRRAMLAGLISAQLESVRREVETASLPCSQEINWDKLSEEFNAHVQVSEDSIKVTANPETISEIGFFLKQRESFSLKKRN